MNELSNLLRAAFIADAKDFMNNNGGYIDRPENNISEITRLIDSTEVEQLPDLLYPRFVFFSEDWQGQLTTSSLVSPPDADAIQDMQDQYRAMIPGFVLGLMYRVDGEQGI